MIKHRGFRKRASRANLNRGYFELSPMYHQHILKRMLDTIRLIQDNEIFDSALIKLIENKSSTMLSKSLKI